MARGYTLIELLIVAGISVVVLLGGFLNLANYRTAQDLSIATRSVVATLRDAQSNAVTGENGFAWGVRFVGGAQGTATLFSTTGSVYNPIATTTLKNTLEFRNPASGIKDVAFNQLTGYPSSGGTVIIKLGVAGSETSSTTITIYANGRIEY